MQTPGDRFRLWLRKYAKKEPSEFADIIGISAKNLNNILRNKIKSVIPKESLDRILQSYPKFPVEWIKNGEGAEPSDETAVFIPPRNPCQEYINQIELFKKAELYREKYIEGIELENEKLKDILRKNNIAY